MTGLAGKVAIVGGSSQGIGYAIARRLAGDGADVALVARRAEPLEAAASRIRDETGRHAFAVAADIRKAADCERIIAEPLAHFGRLDILVNNDGAPPLGELMSFDDAAWDKAWQQNFMSVVRLTRGAVPAMRAAGGGRIVNITALSVLQPMRVRPPGRDSAGVIGTPRRSLEVAADNITVTTICPVASHRAPAKVFAGRGGGKAGRGDRGSSGDPLGRPAAEEIAGLVALLSPRRRLYHRRDLHVDGGRRANPL
jgi:3-oxoacyl-[acyl-carrier protein] reductase